MMPACIDKLLSEVKTMVWSYIDYDYPSDPFQRESVPFSEWFVGSIPAWLPGGIPPFGNLGITLDSETNKTNLG